MSEKVLYEGGLEKDEDTHSVGKVVHRVFDTCLQTSMQSCFLLKAMRPNAQLNLQGGLLGPELGVSFPSKFAWQRPLTVLKKLVISIFSKTVSENMFISLMALVSNNEQTPEGHKEMLVVLFYSIPERNVITFIYLKIYFKI